jgi:hypothetical protein
MDDAVGSTGLSEQIDAMSAQARPKRRTGIARFSRWTQEDYENDLIRNVPLPAPLDNTQTAMVAEISLLDNRTCFILGPGSPERWEIKRLLINACFSDVAARSRYFLERAAQVFHDYQESHHRRIYLIGVVFGITGPLLLSEFLGFVRMRLGPVEISTGLGMDPSTLITLIVFAGLGTFCSVATRLSDMALAEQTDRRLLLISGAFRPITAQIFALALYKLVQLGLITISVKDGRQADLNAVIAFLSGFSERFAGELISRTASAFGTSAESSAGSRTTPGNGGAQAGRGEPKTS